MQHKHVTRRNVVALLGASAAGVAAATAFPFVTPKPFSPFPTVGGVTPVRVAFDPIPNPPVSISLHRFCLLGLASGIHIRAHVEMRAAAGATPSYFGRLALLQVTHFHHVHTPSFMGSPKHCDVAQSGANWELDGQYPYLHRIVPCRAGLNTIEMADNPNVPTEADHKPDETLDVQPLDRFQTWLIWEQTDNGKPPSASNPLKPHALARVDWAWKGSAGPGTTCNSMANAGNRWSMANDASTVSIVYGSAAGMPPDPKHLPAASPSWQPC